MIHYMSTEKILVSACLVGINCRYDCKSKTNPLIVDLLNQGLALPVCPEQLGGLSTPRSPAEIVGDKVITAEGIDVSASYEEGAQEALKLAQAQGIKKAILKSKSPMCGKDLIYDGQFSGSLTSGHGILTKLLLANGFEVDSSD